MCIRDSNRGTFYLHYTDVYDLLSRIEEEMLTDFENVLGKLVPEEIVGQQSPSPVSYTHLMVLTVWPS